MLGPVLASGSRGTLHRAAALACAGSARAFDHSLGDVKAAQLTKLDRLLSSVAGTAQARRLGLEPGLSPEQFRVRVPEASYATYRDAVERQRRGAALELTSEPCARHQPTSGSSSEIKWIPYPRAFLEELDAAISPWGADLYRRFPKIRRGRHYWSLSWLPDRLRGATAANVNDDRALLSWSKRLFSALTSSVPPWVTTAQSSRDSVFATLCFLAASEDLSLLSVWSPTFALNLLEALAENRERIADVLERGRWQPEHTGMPGPPPPRSPRAARLLRAWNGNADAGFFAELWPMLALVSAWDTSSSRRWARQLTRLLPHASFQGKGLWATEGVLTIPYRDQYPLALRSHYYEFVDLDDEKPCFAWELREGQMVRPLLSTAGGLLRYALRDRLVIRGFLGTTPCFEYLSRIDDVDLVGEKMSPESAAAALACITEASCQPLSLLAVVPADERQRPHYVALCEGAPSHHDERRSAVVERFLQRAFHYSLARDLGQLGPARVLTAADARSLYYAIGEARGMVPGNLKPEPLLACSDRSAELVLARTAHESASEGSSLAKQRA